MSLQDSLFRKVALERLSSPEQLDALPRVITVPGWMALAALLILLVTAMLWSWFGEIPTKIVGGCVLLNPSGIADISSGTGGRVVELLVKVGDEVRPQQPVARVAQPELVDQIDKAESRVLELEAQLARQQEYNNRSANLNSRLVAQTRQNLEAQRRVMLERAHISRERVSVQAKLLEQGLITQQTLLATQQEQAGAELEAENLGNQIEQLALRTLEQEKQGHYELAQVKNQLQEARRMRDSLSNRIGEQTMITSPYDGRIVEIKAAAGMLVSQGASVASVERKHGGGVEAVVYVPATEGKKIRPSMRVQVVPTTVKREENGFMLAEVSYVGEYPASPQNVMLVLQNEFLAKEMAGVGASIEVRANLLRDEHGQYRWSSKRGMHQVVRPGTLCQADIVVERQRPLSLVIPTLKKQLGLD